jgi:hypothetical protein
VLVYTTLSSDLQRLILHITTAVITAAAAATIVAQSTTGQHAATAAAADREVQAEHAEECHVDIEQLLPWQAAARLQHGEGRSANTGAAHSQHGRGGAN